MPPLGFSPHLVHDRAAMHRRSEQSPHRSLQEIRRRSEQIRRRSELCQTSTNLYLGESTLIDQLCVSMSIRTWHHTCHCCIIIYLPRYILLLYYLLSLIPGHPPPRTAGLRPVLRPRLRLRPWCAGGENRPLRSPPHGEIGRAAAACV